MFPLQVVSGWRHKVWYPRLWRPVSCTPACLCSELPWMLLLAFCTIHPVTLTKRLQLTLATVDFNPIIQIYICGFLALNTNQWLGYYVASFVSLKLLIDFLRGIMKMTKCPLLQVI